MSGTSRIGPYRILRLLREGGQGSVYLGYDSRLQRRVAVKLYRLPRERQARREMLEEARLVASIDSPRVVKLYDVISSAEHLALIMEYVPGCDLEELLQRGPLSLNAILNLAIDISSALASARQRRIVHGDLKASNVLVSVGGRAQLTDFGIARVVTVRGGAGNRAGSVTAVSPEQYEGKALDVRSDLFALGCLLYRLLSGQHPFVHETELDVQQLLLQNPAPLPSVLADGTPVPNAMRALVQRLLEKQPADRPVNTHRVRQILRDLARDQPQSMRQLPLAGARSVQRRESEDDLPPTIPKELSRRGRSQLGEWRGFSELTPQTVFAYVRKPRVQVAGLMVFLVAFLLAWWLAPKPHRIALLAPSFAVVHSGSLPQGMSVRWLSTRVCSAAAELDQRLLFYDAPPDCPEGRRGFADNRELPLADEQLRIGLRCSRDVCLLGLTRMQDTTEQYRQAVLLPGMTLSQWSAVVTELTERTFSDRR